MDDVAAGRRFSASEAAFTGFRLIAREPVAALVWAGIVLATGLLFGVLTVVTVGPAMADMMAMSAQADPAAQMALVGRLAPLYALSVPLSLVFYGLFYGAVNRAVLRPEQKSLGYLRFGGDELKQIAVLFLYFAVLVAVEIAAAVLMLILLVVVGGVAVWSGAAGSAAGSTGALAAVLVVLLGLGVLGAILFIGVRLSLCTPLTFDKGAVDLSGSWRMTRRRFWPLFGAYLLAWLVCMVLLLTVAVVFAAIVVAVGGGLQAAGVIFRPHTESLAAYFAPLPLVWLVLASAMSSVWLAVLIGAPAGAYAQLRDLETPAPRRPADHRVLTSAGVSPRRPVG